MTEEKKPDNVVFNTDTNRYDAALKPYATSVGAPVITSTDTTAWKNRSINKTNHKLNAKYLELKAEYEKMTREFEYNSLIFNSHFSFEPVIGEVYHLYKRENGKNFLSLIAPDQCNFNHLGSFYLNVDQTWEKVVKL
ncbi:MAG: GTP-binding protein [Aequorivita sp.]|nr:GTP-binding protein [Aequorivita sp.]MBF31372.1 GTP-binding protein [Aequorivita sp.]|tara:strand:+ start:38105 stop:38515 length:411 start_codon:yes stop_codon:yes gene_type:complete